MHRSLALLSVWFAACGGEVVEGTGVPATTGAASTGGETSGETSDASASGTPTMTDASTSGMTSEMTTGVTPTTSSASSASSTGDTTSDESTGLSGSTGPDTTTGEPGCGDGVVDVGEQCDDGNPIEGDDCTNACVRLRSCLELLMLDPALQDGVYTIDPEGDGTTLSVFCDMANGGWTVVVAEDLDTPMGWSMGSGSQCGGIGSLLGGSGQFGAGAVVTKNFPLLGVPHTQLGALAVVAIIDSWDGESMTLDVDGQVLATQACAHNPPTCNQGGQECGMPQWPDGQIALAGVRDHATDAALVKVSSTLDQDPGNEAWGLNALAVSVR